ncbi:MAG: hypothetical protein UT87_C0012G0039 [Candidatus Levybacteria bacterium GW2011_GWC1_40_19]|nr:MAG: hypothetical protein UT44_C0034G0008 [Candidatus Levybacteria bacterium GW2011_GWA1_39_32]KKR50794.1 MAG: hypothetical protein UT87_C0012G0039 [Candidatus Levybacteria bacterium GW2011_GWC1_40_19]KKR93202.1 MAG: hypothetical protein UU45_C0025G0006 [Candidatus Levybacteria bacterium GW2011_GWA2_41_15]KKS00449.1 MAG: hypothetical protein UU52_C0033G0011 [Candidatus Levybacteria bacterium GW2011_GWB1_41_21]OGH20975.1 MAG: hypothetical protein A2695_02970 [Candidatus Levybacteria bacterium
MMGKKVLIVFFGISIFLLVASSSFAHHKARVLGESTQAADLVFPNTVTAGPGFILPDSPFFVLDNIWQKLKLVTAFSPEAKAKIRAQIAGERLAELRIMLSRNNPEGIATALSQIESDATLAAKELSDASASGENVEEAAKELNEAIKLQREVLGILSGQTRGFLRLEIKAARESLRSSKVEVEDELPEELLEDEINEAEEEGFDEDIEDALELTEDIEDGIELDEDEDGEASGEAKNATESLKKLQDIANEQKSEVSNSESSNSGSSGSGSGSSGSGKGSDDD